MCGDKNATFLCLSTCGISCVPHIAFMNPNDPLVFDFVDHAGSMAAIHVYAKDNGYNVVLKPLRGTGGNDVIHARNGKELEAAVLHLFSKDYALSISPYIDIEDEFRLVVLQGTVRLVYKKMRFSVIGDGVKSVQHLVGDLLAGGPQPDLVKGISRLGKKDLCFVPPKGAMFPIEWRHNLGKGAVPQIFYSLDDPVLHASLVALATQAVSALNISFCSVDIIKTASHSLKVLEVNSGVMMDSFIQHDRAIVKQIYTDAIRVALVDN